MTIYPVTEDELDKFQMFTNDVTWYSAIASGAASWGAAVAWEWATTNDAYNETRVGMILGSVLVAVVAAVVAWRSEGKRVNAMNKLKASAQVIEIETATKQVPRGKTN